MSADQVVELGRLMLQEVALLIAPVLTVVILVSLLVNIVQVLTSLQDQTVAAVPRLLATGAALFFLMPWMWRHLAQYTVSTLSNFDRVMR